MGSRTHRGAFRQGRRGSAGRDTAGQRGVRTAVPLGCGGDGAGGWRRARFGVVPGGEPVQRAVDRRFNRARYNAEAVVAAFTSRLGQTVDFNAVQGELMNTVHHAFQPTDVSIWSADRRCLTATRAEPLGRICRYQYEM